MERVMTIAGSDSGGGAGIEADLKTFAAVGVYGTVALTAVTAQNTLGVRAVYSLPAGIVRAQIEAVLEDIGADAAKTGMLGEAAVVEAVSEALSQAKVGHLVVDPVMVSKNGVPLLAPEAVRLLRERLLPLATIVTPNVPELSQLTGRNIRNEEELQEAAAVLWRCTGVKYVLAKGGHLTGPWAADWLYDGRTFRVYRRPRLGAKHTHGTGCTLAAALAAYLAKGLSVPQAVEEAKEFVTRAIAGGLPLGRGTGPVNPLAGWERALER